MNTKLHAVTDREGRPVRLFVTAGQVSDYKGALALQSGFPQADWLLADRGYDADWFRNSLSESKIRACIPPRKSRTIPIKYDKRRYSLERWIGTQPGCVAAVGLGAGPLSQWLHRGFLLAGLDVVLLETRHVKGAPKALPISEADQQMIRGIICPANDRRDGEGIARLLHLGWFRPVHCKSVSAQEVRALLTARKAVQQGVLALEMSLRGFLRNVGRKVGAIS